MKSASRCQGRQVGLIARTTARQNPLPFTTLIEDQMARKLPVKPNIQPSTSAVVRSDPVRSGFRNAVIQPSWSARAEI
jgi:hypothetical protein